MRKLSLLVVALAVLVGTTANAATEPTNSNNPVTITQEIGKFLANPNFDFGQEETAKVSFILNEDYEVVVLQVDAESEAIESYIKARLNYKKLSADAQKGMTYVVPVRLTTEA